SHDPRQLYVTDPIVNRIRVVNPVLLNQNATHAKMRGNGGHLPRLIRLNATDGDQCVAALLEGFGNQVFQFAGFISAVRQATVAVFSLGKKLNASTKMCAQPSQMLNWGGSKGQLESRKLFQVHGQDCMRMLECFGCELLCSI